MNINYSHMRCVRERKHRRMAVLITLAFCLCIIGLGMPVGKPLSAISPTPVAENAPLAGKKIALNAGHGYLLRSDGNWYWERSLFGSVREDLVNAEIVRYLGQDLQAYGAEIYYLREPDQQAGPGISGLPRWQEASRHYLQYLGLPSSVWDTSDPCGIEHEPILCKDWKARSLAANYWGVDLLLGVHNNASNGDGTGTETYYDDSGEYNDPAASRKLAFHIQQRLVENIRSDYNAQWADRDLKQAGFYEIKLAAMPAALTEIAFFDHPDPDNLALSDHIFLRLVASAMAQGICDYFETSCPPTDAPPVIVPTPTLDPAYGDGPCTSAWLGIPGYGSDAAYLTLNTNDPSQSTNTASWQPLLPYPGLYQVDAFLAFHRPINWPCPVKTMYWDTSDAHYFITHKDATDLVQRDQAPLSNQWLQLGQFRFDAGQNGLVQLSDLNHEAALSKTVSASAMRFSLLPPPSPEGVSATDGQFSDRVQIVWTETFGAAAYQIYRQDPASGDMNLLGNTGVTSFDDTTAVPGEQYAYGITAVNAAGAGPLSTLDSGYRTSSPDQPHFNACAENTGQNATIAILSTVMLEGDVSLEIGDELAVVTSDGQLCAGSSIWDGNNISITAWGDNLQTTTKDGLAAGEPFTFVHWDRSAEKEHPVFEAGYSLGDGLYAEQSFHIVDSLTIWNKKQQASPLTAGWNIVSINVQPDDVRMEALLAEIAADITLIKNGNGEVYWPDLAVNQIGSWDLREGYYLHTKKASTLSVEGQPVSPQALPVTLPAGWSMIGYLPQDSLPPATAMSTIVNVLTLAKNNSGGIYWPELGIDSIGLMVPGEGYQVHLAAPAELRYP